MSRDAGGNDDAARPRAWSPLRAAVLSVLLPGAGQMYKGQVLTGFVWLAASLMAYLWFVMPPVLRLMRATAATGAVDLAGLRIPAADLVPGAVVQLLCVADAALRPAPRSSRS